MGNRAESETIVGNLPMLVAGWPFAFYFYFGIDLFSVKMEGERENLGGLLIARYIILLDVFDRWLFTKPYHTRYIYVAIGKASEIANSLRHGSKHLFLSAFKYLWNVVCRTIYISRDLCACAYT